MIRQATDRDYPALSQLWLKSSLAAHTFISESCWQEMLPSVEQHFLPNSETFVFEDRHRLKGFISVLENNYIGALFVAPEFQKQRIGSKLLRYIRRRRPHLNLKVYVKNEIALRFYQSAGFKILGEQIDRTTGETELLMSWAVGCISGFQKRRQGDS